MSGTTGHTQTCSHELLIITMRQFHIAEFTVRYGEVEPFLEHTHPVHEIHVRCQQCIFEQTYDPREVPEWLQPPALVVGKIADWHGDPFPIVQLADNSIAIEIELTCTRCHTEKTTVYVGSGLHSGAFCYVFSYEGEYQANLRDQEYVCDACQEKQT